MWDVLWACIVKFFCVRLSFLKVQLWKRFHIFFYHAMNPIWKTSICVALCKNASPMKNSWDFHGRNVTMAAFFSQLHSIYCLCSGSRHWSLLIWLKVDCSISILLCFEFVSGVWQWAIVFSLAIQPWINWTLGIWGREALTN